jgi:hypothetical protein
MRLLILVFHVVVPSVLLAQYLPLTGGTLSGSLTAPSVNAVLNPTSCADSAPPSWCSGSELGAWTQAAINGPCGGSNGACEIVWPAGNWPMSSTITVPSNGISIRGAGSRATHIFYGGSSDALVIHLATFNTIESGTFEGFTIEGSGSGQSGIRIIDTNQAKFYDVTVRNFNGTAGDEGTGFWLDDRLENFTDSSCTTSPCPAWSERNSFINAFSYNNRKGWRFTVNGGTGSFSRFRCIACFANIETGQIGMSVDGGSVANGFIDFSGNIDQTGGTVFSVSGSTSFYSNVYSVHFENNGAAGGSKLLNIASGGLFDGSGKMICYACANSISSAGHYLVQGDHDGLQEDFTFGIGPWLVPQNMNAVEGIGFNLRWDQSNWQSNGDNANNGAAFISDNNGSGDIEIYSIPSTGGGNQTLSQSAFVTHRVATFSSSGLSVKGNFSATGAKSFKIDHPLDPANKYLVHASVESPDMMNIYNGTATTDRHGLAVVALPDYFEALNRDFRYQLTAIGQFAQAIVAKKIVHNRFVIRTNKPGVEVSWQVTGIRHDAYANAYRTPAEQIKPPSEQGHYLQPELFGAPQEQTIGYLGTNSYRTTTHAAPNEPISSSETMSVAREPR